MMRTTNIRTRSVLTGFLLAALVAPVAWADPPRPATSAGDTAAEKAFVDALLPASLGQ